MLDFFCSSRRRHTSGALVTGVQTCALPISQIPGQLDWHRSGWCRCIRLASALRTRSPDPDLSQRASGRNAAVQHTHLAPLALFTGRAHPPVRSVAFTFFGPLPPVPPLSSPLLFLLFFFFSFFSLFFPF